MSISRSTGSLIGTDESSGDSIANNATDTGGEVDVLGDNTSVGEIELYLVFTSTVTAGTLDVTINKRRVSGQAYAKLGPEISVAPINGTQKIPLGRRPAGRYMQASVKNNSTGASATNVALLYELFKGS
jgi:hypothetical protein